MAKRKPGKRRDPEQWKRIYARDCGRCRFCGCGGIRRLSLDHVLPRSRGGLDDDDNLVIACDVCNQFKGARTPEEAAMTLLDPGTVPCPECDGLNGVHRMECLRGLDGLLRRPSRNEQRAAGRLAR